jgi:hypothetical protein
VTFPAAAEEAAAIGIKLIQGDLRGSKFVSEGTRQLKVPIQLRDCNERLRKLANNTLARDLKQFRIRDLAGWSRNRARPPPPGAIAADVAVFGIGGDPFPGADRPPRYKPSGPKLRSLKGLLTIAAMPFPHNSRCRTRAEERACLTGFRRLPKIGSPHRPSIPPDLETLRENS